MAERMKATMPSVLPTNPPTTSPYPFVEPSHRSTPQPNPTPTSAAPTNCHVTLNQGAAARYARATADA